MIKKFILIVGLLCSSGLFAMHDFFGDNFGGYDSGFLDDLFPDDTSAGTDPESAARNIQPSTTMSTGSQLSSSSESNSSSSGRYHNTSTSNRLPQQSMPPVAPQHEGAQPAYQPVIELHEVNRQLFGYIQGIGYLPVVFSPAFKESTDEELRAYHDAILAQTRSTSSEPLGSPIAANSTNRTSSDDSIEEGGSAQNSGYDMPIRQYASPKRSRPSDIESSIQPQAQGVDPLDKYIATFFDAIIKCGFQNTGANAPTLIDGVWQMKITDLSVFVKCVYQARAQVKQAQKLRDRIKTVKGYFSSWPEDVSEAIEFIATIKSSTKRGIDLSKRIVFLLAKFTEVTQQNEDHQERKSKRQKIKE